MATFHIRTLARVGVAALAVAAVVVSAYCCAIHARVLTPSAQKTWELLKSERFAELDWRFTAMQFAYKIHFATDDELRASFRVFYNPDATLAPKYDSWVSMFPKSYVARLARGVYYTYVGAALRGKQSRDETPSNRLNAADTAYERGKVDLEASFALDPKPLLSYTHAMTITQEQGDLGGSRGLLERAILIDANNYIARAKYVTVIETRWGGSQTMMQEFLRECHRAKLSELQMQQLESVIAEDQGWIHQFVDKDYAAAESDYRRSAALGGDKQLANLADVLFKQQKYGAAIEPLTERLGSNPDDFDLLATRGFAYMQSGKPREGLSDLEAAAKGGSAYAQSELGRMYMIGIPGVLMPNFNVGLAWFRKSAAQGYEAGRQNLERALALLPSAQR
jgi:tetratricopeptide (TPR) repeat protein